MFQAQTIGKLWNEYWSSLFLVICEGKKAKRLRSEAIDQSFQDFTQQFNNRLTNYEFGELEQLRT